AEAEADVTQPWSGFGPTVADAGHAGDGVPADEEQRGDVRADREGQLLVDPAESEDPGDRARRPFAGEARDEDPAERNCEGDGGLVRAEWDVRVGGPAGDVGERGQPGEDEHELRHPAPGAVGDRAFEER